MMRWKKSSNPGLCFETVVGRRPSKLRLMRFFSSTGKSLLVRRSRRKMMSTEVTKQLFDSSR